MSLANAVRVGINARREPDDGLRALVGVPRPKTVLGLLDIQRAAGNRAAVSALSALGAAPMLTVRRGGCLGRPEGGREEPEGGGNDPFAGLPADAMAVHRDGYYIRFHGGLEGLGRNPGPTFYSTTGADKGKLYLSGVSEDRDGRGRYIRIFEIINESENRLPKAVAVLLWYVTKHGDYDYVEFGTCNTRMYDVASALGMDWKLEEGQVANDMHGPTELIYERALAAAESAGWTLRDEQ